MNDGLKQAIEKAGGLRALARKLGLAHTSVLQWKKVPDHQIIAIERVTGVPREILRPDLYRSEPEKVE
jgi:DNA-binding transcriptional regulator YdaS (Cro superfamily)